MKRSPSQYLKDFYLGHAFRPDPIGLFINPFFSARRGLYQNIRDLAHLTKGDILDVGCGSKPYRKLFRTGRYVGLELDTLENRATKQADYFYDGHAFPFQDDSFDTVIANQVLEHVFNPDEFLGEVNRVLKPQGGLLLTTPFVWDEHEQPNDYARYSSFGLRHLLSCHSFTIVEQKKSISDIRVIFQLANCYFYKKLAGLPLWLRLPFNILSTIPLNIIGELLHWVLPGNHDLYLDNVVFARKEENDGATPKPEGG